MTPTGIEPVLPPWKGDVLTAWPRSHWCLEKRFFRFSRDDLASVGVVLSHLTDSSSRSSPSRARTYNNSVNSRVLYHWAIEENSRYLSKCTTDKIMRWELAHISICFTCCISDAVATERLMPWGALTSLYLLQIFWKYSSYLQNRIPNLKVHFSESFILQHLHCLEKRLRFSQVWMLAFILVVKPSTD